MYKELMKMMRVIFRQGTKLINSCELSFGKSILESEINLKVGKNCL